MTTIAENIKKLMEVEGINPAELSRKAGIERSTLHRILDGTTKNPTIESIKAIIKYYNFESVVFGIHASNKRIDGDVPIISWSEVINYPSDKIPTKQQFVKTSVKDAMNAFALILEDHLDSRFVKGSVLIVDPDRPVKNRSYVIVKENNSPLPLIKRYIVEGSIAYLKPIEPSLPSTHYDPEKFKTIGVIVQSIFDFEE